MNAGDHAREQHVVTALDAFARAGITGAPEEPVLRTMQALHEAVRIAVDALENAMQANGTAGRRQRIEHLEYARE